MRSCFYFSACQFCNRMLNIDADRHRPQPLHLDHKDSHVTMLLIDFGITSPFVFGVFQIGRAHV